MEERETRMEAMRQNLSHESAFREAVARYLFSRLQLPEDTRERNRSVAEQKFPVAV